MRGRAGFVVAVTGAALVGLVALASCAAAPRSRHATAESTHETTLRPLPLELRYGHGPVVFVAALSSTKITTAQSVELTLTTRSKPGWRVHFPTIGRTLGRFTVADRHVSRSRPIRGDRILRERSYDLVPFLPGDYELPPLVVTASDGKSTLDLRSKAIGVKVESLIPLATKILPTLRPAAGSFTLSETVAEIFAGAVVLFAALAATLIFFIGRWRSRQRERTLNVPPWIRALRELDRLEQLDLASKGMHNEFYHRINRLLRRYVEEMFDLSAPEQTTEVFLFTVKDSTLLGRHRRVLGEFLAHCDLVKFASYLPVDDEVNHAISTCRAFIDSSRSDLTDQTSGGSQR